MSVDLFEIVYQLSKAPEWLGWALVAVVVNGDAALAERICDLLNEHGDEDLMTPGMPNPCQPIGCDNGIHLPGCAYAVVDADG